MTIHTIALHVVYVKTLLCAVMIATAAQAVDVNRLADAIYLAEGGDSASVPYGIKSVRVADKAEARKVCINTIKHAQRDFAGPDRDFIKFLGARYCPVGASNDPHGLNRHWVSNVTRLYFQSTNKK